MENVAGMKTLRSQQRKINFSAPVTALILIIVSYTSQGDTLQWNPSGSSAAFTSSNWYNATTSTGGQGPGNTSAFNTLLFAGAGTNAKDAPTAMTVGASTSFTELTFNNNFNSTNTTAISNGTSSNWAFHIANGGSISNSASSGTVTFSKSGSGTFTFNLYGDNTITVGTGAAMVFDSSVVLANETIANNGGIIKSGGGKLTLAGANTYTKGTSITSGVLQAGAASAAATFLGIGNVSVNGGTLTLNSSSVGAVQIAGTSSSFTLNSGVLSLDLANLSSYDQLIAIGTNNSFKINGGTIKLTGALTSVATDGYTIFSGFTGSNTVGAFTFDTTGLTGLGSYMPTLSTSGVLTFTIAAVPEPSEYAIGIVGLLGLVIIARRRVFVGV